MSKTLHKCFRFYGGEMPYLDGFIWNKFQLEKNKQMDETDFFQGIVMLDKPETYNDIKQKVGKNINIMECNIFLNDKEIRDLINQ